MLTEKQIGENRRFAKRMEETGTMTENQRRAMSVMCTTRHLMHSRKRRPDGDYLKNFYLRLMPIMLRQAALPGLELCDIYDSYREEEKSPSVTDCLNEALNTRIESWLAAVDRKYATAYAPTGKKRAMYYQATVNHI